MAVISPNKAEKIVENILSSLNDKKMILSVPIRDWSGSKRLSTSSKND
jgi:hypothetical protein